MTDSRGENEVAPKDQAGDEGGTAPASDPSTAPDRGALRDGGSEVPAPPRRPTTDRTVELKAAGVDVPDIGDVFTPTDGEDGGDTPAPPRRPERPKRPTEAPASEPFDPNKTSAIPAGSFDPTKTSIFPAGDISTYNPDGDPKPPPPTEPPADETQPPPPPPEPFDPNKTSTTPAGDFDPNKTSNIPAGAFDPTKTAAFPAGSAPVETVEQAAAPPDAPPPPPPAGQPGPAAQDPTGPAATLAPLSHVDPTLDEPAGDIANYNPDSDANPDSKAVETDDPNATVIVDPSTTTTSAETDDPNATVIVDPSTTTTGSATAMGFDPNATVIIPGAKDDQGADPNATVIMPDEPGGSDPDRDQPPHPNAPGPPASGDATSILKIPTAELPPTATDSPADGATQLATPPPPADTPTEVVAAVPAPPPPPGDDPSATVITPGNDAAGPVSADIGTVAGSEGSDVKAKGKSRRRLRLLLLAIVALLVLLYVAWVLDLARVSGEVIRGTKLGTTSIAGFDAEQLDGLADELNAELAASGVELNVGDTVLTSDPVTLGAGIDREAMTEAALDARRNKNPITGPFSWLSTFFSQETIEPIYLVDESVTSLAVEDIMTNQLDQPQEPGFQLQDDGFTVSPGRDGIRLEASEVAEQLISELDQAGGPYTLSLTPITAEPKLDTSAVEEVASEVNGATAGGAVFRILDQSAVVEENQLRQWVELDTSGSAPSWSIDSEQVIDDLKPLFPSLGSEDQKAHFNIVDGEPIIIPASETVICCTPESVAEIRQQLLEPLPEPPVDENSEEPADNEPVAPERVITLDPEVVGSDEGVAELESLGIVEEVSSFTTMHACCQNRVTNIHRFADIVRGAIIRPGEEFSLNGYVGRRTIENGFVADGAIANGVLEKQVGGGVSQFATTFFNASFYAGIDFNEYQSHSLYISRYPKGREATISFPRPDLSVTNTTDYGILIWPTYTPTSITVTFYSTKHIEVEDLPLQRSARGQCTVYTTPRVRTYPDGTTVEDSVFALYRPGEGLDCNGNSTVPTEPSGPTIVPSDSTPIGPTPTPTSAPAAPAPTTPGGPTVPPGP